MVTQTTYWLKITVAARLLHVKWSESASEFYMERTCEKRLTSFPSFSTQGQCLYLRANNSLKVCLP